MCLLSKQLFSCYYESNTFKAYVAAAAAAAAKSLQSCPTLCDPRDGSPPGSPIPGILQARTLEWVAISSVKAYGKPEILLNLSLSLGFSI